MSAKRVWQTGWALGFVVIVLEILISISGLANPDRATQALTYCTFWLVAIIGLMVYGCRSWSTKELIPQERKEA